MKTMYSVFFFIASAIFIYGCEDNNEAINNHIEFGSDGKGCEQFILNKLDKTKKNLFQVGLFKHCNEYPIGEPYTFKFEESCKDNFIKLICTDTIIDIKHICTDVEYVGGNKKKWDCTHATISIFVEELCDRIVLTDNNDTIKYILDVKIKDIVLKNTLDNSAMQFDSIYFENIMIEPTIF